ncbi:prenyltransferase [Lactobacillus crispatus]|uniref:prenyltransferase n=1 Tax=Lactobacillus crispatus TaxID=47770 RepID=UPI00254CBECC|nr:prenyltransferase [Lactobacillus crispatus]MDK7314424.1 prenyltransferase [Lactobacillus crispatus]
MTDINPIGRLKLPLTDVRNLVWISYFISAIPGIILVYRTGWPVLIMGVVGYFIGIFYTAGPKPLNATPICELVVSFFISYFIMLVSIYVTIYGTYPLTWNLALTTLIRCLPLTLIFYALQLANNTCDLHEDLNNGRHTLASYTGKKYALKIIKTLIIAGLLFPIIVVLFGLAKWPLIFSCFLLPILWQKLKQFFEHPDKQTTYLQMIKYLSIFFITYIAIYTVLVETVK